MAELLRKLCWGDPLPDGNMCLAGDFLMGQLPQKLRFLFLWKLIYGETIYRKDGI